MDEQSKATFDEIVAKEPAALSDSEKDFLRARRSYLSAEQRSVFAEVIAEPKVKPAPAKQSDNQPTGDPTGEQPKAKPFNKMNKAELGAELDAREIAFDVGATNPELVALLEEFEAKKEPKTDETKS